MSGEKFFEGNEVFVAASHMEECLWSVHMQKHTRRTGT